MRIRDNYRDHRLKIEKKMGLIELGSKRLLKKKNAPSCREEKILWISDSEFHNLSTKDKYDIERSRPITQRQKKKSPLSHRPCRHRVLIPQG